MRLLALQHEVFLVFKSVLLDFAIGEEGYGEFTSVEVQSVLDQINAALVPLQVVQPKQQVYFVVFQHSKRALDRLATP